MKRAVIIASLLGFPSAARAERSADQVLTEMGFSAEEKQRVIAGEFVTTKVGAVSERDLCFAIAFMVKAAPEALSAKVLAGALISADPQVQAYGTLSAPGSLADFSGLKLTDDEAHALTAAGTAAEMNRSADERASFEAQRGDATHVVEEQLRRMLLARYESYRSSGLAGIAPYDRGKGKVADVALDLKTASEAAAVLRKHLPALQEFLLDPSRSTVPSLRQNFLWLKSNIRGKPTYVLAHILAAGDGEARAVVRREFYVSTGYDAEQSVAGFLPVAGGTVVVCLSHAFTEQVTGSGGAMKRSIGSRVMAGQMKEIFETGRKQIER